MSGFDSMLSNFLHKCVKHLLSEY